MRAREWISHGLADKAGLGATVLARQIVRLDGQLPECAAELQVMYQTHNNERKQMKKAPRCRDAFFVQSVDRLAHQLPFPGEPW